MDFLESCGFLTRSDFIDAVKNGTSALELRNHCSQACVTIFEDEKGSYLTGTGWQMNWKLHTLVAFLLLVPAPIAYCLPQRNQPNCVKLPIEFVQMARKHLFWWSLQHTLHTVIIAAMLVRQGISVLERSFLSTANLGLMDTNAITGWIILMEQYLTERKPDVLLLAGFYAVASFHAIAAFLFQVPDHDIYVEWSQACFPTDASHVISVDEVLGDSWSLLAVLKIYCTWFLMLCLVTVMAAMVWGAILMWKSKRLQDLLKRTGKIVLTLLMFLKLAEMFFYANNTNIALEIIPDRPKVWGLLQLLAIVNAVGYLICVMLGSIIAFAHSYYRRTEDLEEKSDATTKHEHWTSAGRPSSISKSGGYEKAHDYV